MRNATLSALAAALTFAAAHVVAGEATIVVEKETPIVPFVLSEGGAKDEVLEASAVEPIGDGTFLLVAHDKTPGMYVVEAATGKVVTKSLLTGVFPQGEKADPKWEGFARDEQGWYYAAGTHSGKTPEQRARRAHIVRFRFKEGSEGAAPAIDPAGARRWTVATSLDKALKAQGLDDAAVAKGKIEGLSIRRVPAGDGKPARVELAIGLREPTDRVRVFAADLTEPPPADADLPLAPLFSFDAGDRDGVPACLTSLTFVPSWDGYLLTTATEDAKNVFHGNSLWFVAAASLKADGSAVAPERVHDFAPTLKSEGLAELPGGDGDADRLRVVITFDNDPHATHIPSGMQTMTLVRKAK